MNRPKAFTLIELLIVIAVLALLLAILIPSLRKSRRSAQKVVCNSNLKQIGVAANLYAQGPKSPIPNGEGRDGI